MKQHRYFVYILTNARRTVLYTGVTNDLHTRLTQHKERLTPGFTSRYNVDQFVYFEEFQRINDAIAREKQIKGGSRQKKIDMVNSFNAEWKDLSGEVWRL